MDSKYHRCQTGPVTGGSGESVEAKRAVALVPVIRLLGPVELIGPSGALGGGGLRQRALLTRLALDPDTTIERSQLLHDVWNGVAPKSGAGALRVQVQRLRTLLAEAGLGDVLETRPTGYSLGVDPAVIDAFRAADLAEQAIACSVRDPHRAVGLFAEADTLVRGRPLQGLEDLDFARNAAAEISESIGTARRTYGRVLLTLGDFSAAATVLQAAVDADPLSVEAVSMQMRALRLAGRPRDALAAADRHHHELTEVGLIASESIRVEEQLALHHEDDDDMTADTAMIGREQTCAELAGHLDAVAAGAGAVVALAGQSGIGKSSLLSWITDAAERRGVTVYRSGGQQFDSKAPWHAVADLFPTNEAAHAVLDDAARSLLGSSDDRSAVVDDAAAWNRTSVAAKVAEAFTSGLTGPAVVIIDDVQWADPASLSLIRTLALSSRSSPALIVVAGRPVGSWRDHLAAASPTQLSLAPLSAVDSINVAESVLGATLGPELARVVEGSGGLPLFITETLRGLRLEQRLLVTDTSVGLLGEGIPASVRELVDRRLSQLSDEVRAVCELVAVLGPNSEIERLSRLLGETVLEAARRVGDAVEVGLLDTDGAAVTFQHAMVADAVYDAMADSVKAELHRQAATLMASDGMPVTTVVAHATLAAGLPGDSQLAQWFRAAADSTSVLDPETSLQYFTRARELADASPDLTYEVDRGRVEALVAAGRTQEATDLLLTLVDVVPTRIGDTTLRLAGLYLADNRPADALAELQRLIDRWHEIAAAVRTDPGGQDRQLARLHAVAALASVAMLDRPAAIASAETADSLGVLAGDLVARSIANSVLCRVASFELDRERALRFGRLSIELANLDRTGQAHGYQPHSLLAMAALDFDAHHEVEQALNQGRAVSQTLHTPWADPIYDGLSMSLHYRRAEADQVESDAARILARSEQMGTGPVDSWAHGLRALLAMRAGDVDQANQAVESAQESAARSNSMGGDYLSVARAHLLAHQGRAQEGLHHLREVWDLTVAVGVRPILPVVAPSLVRFGLHHGDRPIAKEVETVCHDIAAETETLAYRSLAQRISGLVNGDVGALEEAVRLSELTERPFDTADCRMDAAAIIEGKPIPLALAPATAKQPTR